MATELEIYIDVETWIKSVISGAVVVQGYQNNVPVPKNAIVMTILFTEKLDQLSSYYDGVSSELTIFESEKVKMQLDFYGSESFNQCTKTSTIFKSQLTTFAMTSIQPLNCTAPRNMTFVNEAGQYENRYMLELELQHNPSYKQTVDSSNVIPNIGIEHV
jgi:hypothetical protein